MILRKKHLTLISLMLALTFLFAPFIEAAELSLFDRIKLKTEEKKEQLQSKDWWITKAVSKAAGFVAGKAGGAVGAAVGYVIGAGLGGPVAAGMGAMVGFRIGDIVTKTFAKAVSEVVTQWKLKDEREVSVKTVFDAIRTVNKASLSAESIGAVLGDLIGGSLGAAAGIALLSGTGPIAIPIIGAVSAAYIGSKLGKAVFGGIFRWAGRKIFKKGYEAYAGSEPEDSLSSKQSDARLEYEQAYREYTSAVTEGSYTHEEIQKKLQNYRAAFERYRASFSLQQQN
jgi:hypothetical protein